MFVFISHSHSDKDKAHDLTDWLSKNSVPHFIDDKDIRIGAPISETVRQAITRTTHFILLLSPQSIESKWVNYELGIAEGLAILSPGQISVLPYVVYPVRELPTFLGDKRSVNTLDELLSRLVEDLAAEEKSLMSQSFSSNRQYLHDGIPIPAIRLVGAADEYFPPSAIRVRCDDTPYELPRLLDEKKSSIVSALTAEAIERKAPFFDGPHTRLVDYHFTNAQMESEQKILELTLGQVGWFDASVARWYTDRASASALSKLVDIERVRSSGSVTDTRLPNILDTATTLITRDGKIVYSIRGEQVSVEPNTLTSAVAENIHVIKDESLSLTSNREMPSPFRAALRGIDEELSPIVLERFLSSGQKLRCLGLSYSLDAYHPNILFLGIIPLTLDELLAACKNRPGKDFFEGNLLACSIVNPDPALGNALRRTDWTGGGKASFFRAVEFMQSYAIRNKLSMPDALLMLEEIGHNDA